jgi:hypothetical protein
MISICPGFCKKARERKWNFVSSLLAYDWTV